MDFALLAELPCQSVLPATGSQNERPHNCILSDWSPARQTLRFRYVRPVIEALLFDLDGTLIDSEPLHKQAEIETFAKFGVDVSSMDLQPYTGATLTAMLEGIGSDFGTSIAKESFMEVEIPILSTYIAERMRMFGDAIDFLDATRGVRRALVTSSMPWYVEKVLERFAELQCAFHCIVHGESVSFGKPDPEPYQMAAMLLGVEPDRCLVFEDSLNGIASGVRAGCRVVAIDRCGEAPTGAYEIWPDFDAGRLSRFETGLDPRLK